jgi:hypothetical protein
MSIALGVMRTVRVMSEVDLRAFVEVARLIILGSLESDGKEFSKSDARKWLDALCDLANKRIANREEMNGMER